MTLAYHRYHGVDTKIVRIFNTYGPRMRLRDGRAVPAFMSQALQNEDVTVFGDGSQTRSFCYVTDLVDGILRLMDSNTNEPVNIGNPHEVTIEEIARTIIKLVGSKSQIVRRPLPVDDPKQRRPDITRAQTLLGWEPKVGLEEGLLKTVEYFKKKIATCRRRFAVQGSWFLVRVQFRVPGSSSGSGFGSEFGSGFRVQPEPNNRT